MFRAAASNPLDDSVNAATDENLTSEDWSKILDVCDKVAASPSGPAQAVSSLIKRLAHRNANVQLYTLELANSLAQNCGTPIQRELASKAFTDSLLRLTSDRNTHGQVKQKVLERMGEWTEEFGRNPDFGIMEQAYQKLRVQQPGLMPPSKPVKAQISHEDRRKEDEELQMALALSIKDKGVASPGAQQPNGTSPAIGRDDSEQQPAQQTQAQGTTAATVSRVRAMYDFTPSEPGELAFSKNDIIAVLESVYKDWWKGSLRGQTGIFPLNYVEKLQDPSKEELERDAQMEAEVFGEIKGVEKLLALLSVRQEGPGRRGGEREEEEISELYQRTLSIRPKLIELIGKYSQKKDDFTQLNEKFIKARRDYEALLESSMSHPGPQYGQQQFPIRAPPPRQAPYNAPYGGQVPLPQQGFPPQGPTSASSGYPPQQQPFAPHQSQQHLPPQQDVQRFYSPAPSEPPSQQPPPGPGPGYSSPYPQSDGPPSVLQQGGPAPFHFIPGGLQNAPPPQAQQQHAIRRKPSPQAPPLSAGPGPGPGEPYSIAAQQQFQGQIRPNSIHTLNSGNPQELSTGGYESPIDNRHSYPAANQGYAPQQQPQQGYDGYAPPQQAPIQPRTDRDGLPSMSRQRTHSFESPTSVYSAAHQDSAGASAPPWQQQQQQMASPPVQNQGPPPAEYQYQAYQPQPQQQGQRMPSGSSAAGGDPGDYYR